MYPFKLRVSHTSWVTFVFKTFGLFGFSLEPPQVSLPYTSRVVLSNSMVTLVCNSTQGDYPITFMWTGPDGNMLDMMMISGNNYSSEVTISTAEISVFGKYTCLATNSFGSSNGTLTTVQASK